MNHAWPVARIAWALFGMLALAAGAIGAYFSTLPAGKRDAAPQKEVVLPAHAAPRPVPALAFEDGRGARRTLAGPQFEVVALSSDAGGAAAVKKFYDEIGNRSLGMYVDPASRAMRALGLVGIPTTLLVGRKGREIGRRTGPAKWDGPDAVRMFESFLHEAKP